MKKLTQEEFIERAKKIHPKNNYNYEQSVYAGWEIKVKIFCKRCEQFFEQRASDHMNGEGCPKCSNDRNGESQRKVEKNLLKMHK